MEDLKIYGINAVAVVISALDTLNPILQTLVLSLSAIYTILKIYKNLAEDGKS
jgi:hypothetical protein